MVEIIRESDVLSAMLQQLGSDATQYLSAPPSVDAYEEACLTASLHAANVVHETVKRDHGFLQQHFIGVNEVGQSWRPSNH